MNVILGASGQIGSLIVNDLFAKGHPVRGIVHSDKIKFENGISTQFADFFDLQSTIQALKGGKTVFVITPENPQSPDMFKDTAVFLSNIKIAVKEAGIKKVVGLSCVGADIESGTGNILLSRMLEHTFDDVDVQKVFIRPTYYYSNWLFYMDIINSYGVLPSFIPKDLKVDMLSPIDLSHFCVEQILSSDTSERVVYELFGPEKYSPSDVCSAFEKVLNKKINLQCVEKQNWKKTFMENGFTENAARGMVDMTECLVEIEKFERQKNEKIDVKLPMTLEAFLRMKTKAEAKKDAAVEEEAKPEKEGEEREGKRKSKEREVEEQEDSTKPILLATAVKRKRATNGQGEEESKGNVGDGEEKANSVGDHANPQKSSQRKRKKTDDDDDDGGDDGDK